MTNSGTAGAASPQVLTLRSGAQDLANSLEDCDRADGARGATSDLEWKADEAESTASYEFVEIGKAFHVAIKEKLLAHERYLSFQFAGEDNNYQNLPPPFIFAHCI